MRSGHEEIVIAQNGIGRWFGAPMDRYIFAQAIAVADAYTALVRGIESKILGLRTDYRAKAHKVVIAEFRVSRKQTMPLQDTTVSENDLRANNTERADLAISTELRGGINQSSGMYSCTHGKLVFEIFGGFGADSQISFP
jgi:hypothetical protein